MSKPTPPLSPFQKSKISPTYGTLYPLLPIYPFSRHHCPPDRCSSQPPIEANFPLVDKYIQSIVQSSFTMAFVRQYCTDLIARRTVYLARLASTLNTLELVDQENDPDSIRKAIKAQIPRPFDPMSDDETDAVFATMLTLFTASVVSRHR